jgi:hypothetical protein
MADYESRDLEGAAYLAREADPWGDDYVDGFGTPPPRDPEDECVPLCGASKAYGRFVKSWHHDSRCPARDQPTPEDVAADRVGRDRDHLLALDDWPEDAA